MKSEDVSENADIMDMEKQDVFNEYCEREGLLGGYGYSLLNVVENIYDIICNSRTVELEV